MITGSDLTPVELSDINAVELRRRRATKRKTARVSRIAGMSYRQYLALCARVSFGEEHERAK